jgi:hypothetical protein
MMTNEILGARATAMGNPANQSNLKMKVSRELYPFSYRPEMVFFFFRLIPNGKSNDWTPSNGLSESAMNRLSNNFVKTHRL